MPIFPRIGVDMFGGNKYCSESLFCAGYFVSSKLVVFVGGGVAKYWGEGYFEKHIIGALGGRYCHVAFLSRRTRAA